MAISLIGQVGAVQQNSRFMAQESAAIRFSSATSGGQSAFAGRSDAVDLVGIQSIIRAFKVLGEKEPLPVPKAVEYAIQSLAREVLDGLPKGMKPFVMP